MDNGLLHLFDTVVTTEDGAVQSPKPAPDIFLVAAQRIGVCPTKCIGFEDADLGMQAVKTANYLYASDVRLMHMYPRNVEKRNSTISDNEENENGDDAS
jgi:beta-phosphoglucomutase-like phosphatase (HAD superfamily)